MKNNEIGSEFSYNAEKKGSGIILPVNIIDYAFTFSGRTAIETVLKNEPHIKKALLPSYCCDSMIEPFRKAGITVDFYDVYYEDGLKIKVNINSDIDAVLWCNYFGFDVDMPDMTEFIDRGGVIIEDITHSLLSNQVYHKQSSYLVGSVRKWGPVLSGGICMSLNGYLKVKPKEYPKQEFIDTKKGAMILKQKYLSGDKEINKEKFLEMFSESNKWLANNYSCLKIDDESLEILSGIDWEDVYQKRCNNARILYSGFKTCKNIKPLFDFQQMNCPLFVPVVIENGNRDYIRKKLIENKIYCPIHWPKPNDECKSNLYDIELSLICDQRYDEDDMKKIISILNINKGSVQL